MQDYIAPLKRSLAAYSAYGMLGISRKKINSWDSRGDERKVWLLNSSNKAIQIGGGLISEMRNFTKAKIHIFQGEDVPKVVRDDEEMVEVSKSFGNRNKKKEEFPTLSGNMS
ncbi:hypothetical protein AALP_AAs42659U000100 [Arabis alpina]|uniref:Uncharacterized protein n=1 Tax=Arabis alpina TaxID=50452 RepID=A0A087FXM1_ARAAL|nr:hypothetical protein AALP_AAs42659U000100 [Arabis alpina]